jgi:hypothetical protein
MEEQLEKILLQRQLEELKTPFRLMKEVDKTAWWDVTKHTKTPWKNPDQESYYIDDQQIPKIEHDLYLAYKKEHTVKDAAGERVMKPWTPDGIPKPFSSVLQTIYLKQRSCLYGHLLELWTLSKQKRRLDWRLF